MEILSKYYFEIKYISGTDNIKADALNRKIKQQKNKNPLEVILKLDKNRKVRYNYL